MTRPTRLVSVRRFKRSIGRQCLRCGRPAYVTATRVLSNGIRLPVRYCSAHIDEVENQSDETPTKETK